MSFSARFLRTTLTAALLCAALAVSASALDFGSGVVTADALYLRESNSASSTVLATARKDAKVTVLEDKSNGWYKVELNEKVGYMSASYLSVTPYEYTGTLNTDGSSLNMRRTSIPAP